jgi:hypothetical protein
MASNDAYEPPLRLVFGAIGNIAQRQQSLSEEPDAWRSLREATAIDDATAQAE